MTTMPKLNGARLYPANTEEFGARITWRLNVARVRAHLLDSSAPEVNFIVIIDDATRAVMQYAIGLTAIEVEAALRKAISAYGPPHRLLLNCDTSLDLKTLIRHVVRWGITVEVSSCIVWREGNAGVRAKVPTTGSPKQRPCKKLKPSCP